MARSLSVKVPTAAVIAQVEEAIKKIDEAIASYAGDVAEYKIANDKYKVEVAKYITNFVSNNVSKIGYEHSDLIQINTDYRSRMALSFDADALSDFPVKPNAPKKPNDSEWIGGKHLNRKEVLEQNLRILRMTTQEEINASSYSAVIDLI